MKNIDNIILGAREALQLIEDNETDDIYGKFCVIRGILQLLANDLTIAVLRTECGRKALQMKKKLIRQNICPHCGGEIEAETDYNSPTTQVPYGDTYVSLGDYKVKKICSECGEVYNV